MSSDAPLLSVDQLHVQYDVGHGQRLEAVAGASLSLQAGEAVGLVGESGCGKSSLARAIIQLPRPTKGKVNFEGTDLATLDKARLRPIRQRLKIIFQDSIASLNPRRRIGDLLAEPLIQAGVSDRADRERLVRAALARVGLEMADAAERYPHEFSGGQCQRICIARALVTEPSLMICDEPVSSLDVSVRGQILNLLRKANRELNLALLFVSHDLAAVRYLCRRIVVMYCGKILEIAPTEQLFANPAHPYTRALIDAVLVADPAAPSPATGRLRGELPSPFDPPSGCRFRTRCPLASTRCEQEVPTIRPVSNGRLVACHYPLDQR